MRSSFLFAALVRHGSSLGSLRRLGDPDRHPAHVAADPVAGCPGGDPGAGFHSGAHLDPHPGADRYTQTNRHTRANIHTQTNVHTIAHEGGYARGKPNPHGQPRGVMGYPKS